MTQKNEKPTITIGDITTRRVALGISKAALAREAGLNGSTVSLIENGRLVPYPVQLSKIATALDKLEAQKAAM